MTRQELIKALEDSGAEFTGYKRAKVKELQAACDLMIGKRKLNVTAEWLKNASDPKHILTDYVANEVQQPTPRPRANWGANENPRHCRACKSTSSKVTNTQKFQHPERVVRYRVCIDCGQKYSTLEVSATP